MSVFFKIAPCLPLRRKECVEFLYTLGHWHRRRREATIVNLDNAVLKRLDV